MPSSGARGVERRVRRRKVILNRTLRALGKNDFDVDHTGVARRQRVGTLRVAVDYDQEAFDKAWTYLAENHCDNEGERMSKSAFDRLSFFKRSTKLLFSADSSFLRRARS